MLDEGYIKFNCHWKPGPPLTSGAIQELNDWRNRLYDVQFLGAYPDGIGYGNVSQRLDRQQFVISGSATGNFSHLNEQHYSRVTQVRVEENAVWCEGPIRASSESMSHAAIYHAYPDAQAAFHIHHLDLWEKYRDVLPTTSESAAYGTPEMFWEITRLLSHPEHRATGVFVMAGHREGLFGFGTSLAEAGQKLLDLKH